MKPDWIKIGPALFRIDVREDIGVAGRLRYEPEMVLMIDEKYDPQYQAQTLFHEIQHGIFDVTGDEKHNENEGFVQRCGAAWLTTLLESPGLLEYLIALRDGEATEGGGDEI